MVLEMHGFGLGTAQSTHPRKEFVLSEHFFVLKVRCRPNDRKSDRDEYESVRTTEYNDSSPHFKENNEKV